MLELLLLKSLPPVVLLFALNSDIMLMLMLELLSPKRLPPIVLLFVPIADVVLSELPSPKRLLLVLVVVPKPVGVVI